MPEPGGTNYGALRFMPRVIAALILLAGAGAAFAQTTVNVNWNERIGRHTRYVEKNAREQNERITVLGKRSEEFQRRAQQYARDLEKRVLAVKDNSAPPK